MTKTLALGICAAVLFAFQAAAQDKITLGFASFGGAYQEAQRKAFLEPTAKSLNIAFREDTLTGIAEVRAQVRAGAVKWDIADLGASDCAIGEKEGLFEPLDYAVIDAKGFAPQIVQKSWIGIIYYSNVIAWSTEKYAQNGPKSWAEFWDVQKFPGARSLRNRPIAVLEVALLADGVAPDKLYPLDVDRAFRSLEKIKPHVRTWWTSGAQSAQLMKDREIDLIHIWNGRMSAAIKDGAKAAFTYGQGLLSADCLVVPKGAKNKDMAMKAIALFLTPQQQANLAKIIDYGPVNPKAFDAGILTTEEAARVNSSPDNATRQAVQDFTWWGEHGAKVQERWDAFIAKK